MQSGVLSVPIIWLFCKSLYGELHRKSLLICLKIGTRGPYFRRYRCPDSEVSKITIGKNRHEEKMNTLTLIIDPENTFTGVRKGYNYAVDVDVYKDLLPTEVREELKKLCPIYRHELTESEAWQLVGELVRLLSPHRDLRVRVSDLTKPIR